MFENRQCHRAPNTNQRRASNGANEGVPGPNGLPARIICSVSLLSLYRWSVGRRRRIGRIPRIWTAASSVAPHCRQALLKRNKPTTAGSVSTLAAATIVCTPRINHHRYARLDAGGQHQPDRDDETCCFENSQESLLELFGFRVLLSASRAAARWRDPAPTGSDPLTPRLSGRGPHGQCR
jgi:hypothetical protein